MHSFADEETEEIMESFYWYHLDRSFKLLLLILLLRRNEHWTIIIASTHIWPDSKAPLTHMLIGDIVNFITKRKQFGKPQKPKTQIQWNIHFDCFPFSLRHLRIADTLSGFMPLWAYTTITKYKYPWISDMGIRCQMEFHFYFHTDFSFNSFFPLCLPVLCHILK